MISCTEFIPLYSEFFKYLAKRGGGDQAVMDYWIAISDGSIGDKTNPNSLAYKCEQFGGFEGAIAYWGHTLTEEACDLFEMEDWKGRIKYSHMRHCPSRGMLNELKHVEPYYDYCSHCNVIYGRILEKYGVVLERDNLEIENAACRECFYEKGKKPDFDFRTVKDEDLQKREGQEGIKIIDMKSEDNKYLHRDFHTALDNALRYCGDKFGTDEVINFLKEYVKNFYAPVISEIKEKGFSAIVAWLESIYQKEEASSYLHTELAERKLVVSIDKCPAIEYMHSLRQEPSQYYIETTKTLYSEIANQCGYNFELKYYEADGKTQFVFEKFV